MKRIFLSTIIILLAAFLVLNPANSRGQETYLPDMEVQLVELINAARENPLGMAWLLGMDPNQVLADLPWLSDSLTQGLPPLQTDSVLTDAARSHTQDMLALDYYGYDSLDGTTPEGRIREAGYYAGQSGEALGLLGFFNFIEPSSAVFQIFSRLFKDELNPERTRPRNILDSELEDVGVGFGAGTLTLGGVPYNVYLATCDFATGAVSVLERELLQLMNQARANPLAMAQNLGLDPLKTLEDLPELRDILLQGLPPLVFHNRLHESATGHCRDMIENGYFSGQSPDGATPEDRIAEAGYEAEVIGEIIGSLASFDYLAEKDAAFQIFVTKFKEELDPERDPERVILSGAFKDGGVCFEVSQLQVDSEEPGIYDLMVVDLGKSSLPAKPVLTGVVYNDINGDGLYGLGEGIPHASVTVNGSDASFPVFTNMAGGFTLELDPGLYTVTIDSDESIPEKVVDLQDENLGIWFIVNSVGGVAD